MSLKHCYNVCNGEKDNFDELALWALPSYLQTPLTSQPSIIWSHSTKHIPSALDQCRIQLMPQNCCWEFTFDLINGISFVLALKDMMTDICVDVSVTWKK